MNAADLDLTDRTAQLAYSDHLEETGRLDEAVKYRIPKVSRANRHAKAICKALAYTGRKIKVSTARADRPFELDRNYWDDGTRSYWWVAALNSNGVCGTHRAPDSGGPWSGAAEYVEIEPDMLLVKHSIFCGKDCGLTIYGTAETLCRLFQ